MKIGQEYNGFLLKESKKIQEINSLGRLFEHKKTGLKLFAIENDDDNNIFSVAFRTPSHNNGGLAHILEHCVLNGSKNFPIKDPFKEMFRSSLNTFLNAITFPDRTVYPIGSRNEQDYFNLMEVYLDAVFYPNIKEKEEIFLQEGWYYQFDKNSKSLSYNGIVYNEMKGSLSSPDTTLFRRIQSSLYPDTQYYFNSGGEPRDITKLTYSELLDYHSRFYHPSNAYIFIYGDIDIEKKLEFLNTKYLNDFTKKKINSEIKIQKSLVKPEEVISEYSISKEETIKDKTYLSLNFSVDKSTNPELYLAFQILTYILVEAEGAPLKDALLQKGLGKNAFGLYANSIYQPFFSILLKNSNFNKKVVFEKTVMEKLKELVTETIDQDLIQGALNKLEFDLREAEFRRYPRGLVYNFMVLDSWIYNNNPYSHLEFNNILEKIKKKSTEGYFEKLIDKYLLKNTHKSLVVLKPKSGLIEENDKTIEKYLKGYKDKLKPKELENIIKKNKQLKKYQETPEDPKDLAKIPRISVGDIEKKAEKIPVKKRKITDKTILLHPIETNNITYLEFFFDTKHIPQQYLQYLTLFTTLLGKVSTKKHNYRDLNNLINKYTGGIRFKRENAINIKKPFDYDPKFLIRMKHLDSNISKAFTLLEEILQDSIFEDKKRIKELIQQKKSNMEGYIISGGDEIAKNRVLSYFSDSGKYNEYTSGLYYYDFLFELDKNFEKDWNKMLKAFNYLKKEVFNKNKLLISVTCSETSYTKMQKYLKNFLNSLNNNSVRTRKYNLDLNQVNEGIALQSDVQYVAKGYNFKLLGFNFTGTLRVVQSILKLNYLWDCIRVKGGAYGAFLNVSRQGSLVFTSYRDPNIRKTLEVYDNSGDFLRSKKITKEDVEGGIIGAINTLDRPLTPSMKGEVSVRNYLTGITYKYIQNERDELLNTTKKDLSNYADLLDKVMGKNIYCVVGKKENLQKEARLFKKIIEVFK